MAKSGTLKPTRGPRASAKTNVLRYVLNCVPSKDIENDWTLADAASAGIIAASFSAPASKDLRASWWPVSNQDDTGACVGFATADGVLRWTYVTANKIQRTEVPSSRFIWMANKETDEITSYPSTFIESEGTQVKLALRVARNFGCVLEPDLPFSGPLSKLSRAAFYTKAARLRISSYHNLGRNLDDWRRWIATRGPILTRLDVDQTWDQAGSTGGHLANYLPSTIRGGHAVCLVGYTPNYFIVRNSWGPGWGAGGFAYASNQYAQAAFTEAYGAVL